MTKVVTKTTGKMEKDVTKEMKKYRAKAMESLIRMIMNMKLDGMRDVK